MAISEHLKAVLDYKENLKREAVMKAREGLSDEQLDELNQTCNESMYKFEAEHEPFYTVEDWDYLIENATSPYMVPVYEEKREAALRKNLKL